jgi:hypothetical protein
MLLSLIQKSKSIIGIGDNETTPNPLSHLPSDLQKSPVEKINGSQDREPVPQNDHKEFQELIYGMSEFEVTVPCPFSYAVS